MRSIAILNLILIVNIMYVSRVKFSIGIIRPPGKNVQSTALGIHALWRHLALLGLA